ncbi:flagellar basal body-associated FliL family protein [Aeoliella sp. ICT_H6.2]|uniref:Flagellar protein FliL n=1 Tax=Aeoliella straminimaris TaxID=2954799 RepID=A0A9X2FG03_9BACT|nr:flagellar basal body-associated FliL family protein [Aeoliella straminimaris]MCO6047347.1 flagellar basal body-associated FliL family protein [Aeoliella straminimaris]
MADEPTTEPQPAKRIGLVGLIKAVAFISVIVLVEVVAASMLVPTAEDTEATARRLVAAEEGQVEDDAAAAAAQAKQASPLADKETIEVELGRYNVTRYNPENDTTLIVDFELFGVVLADDQGGFETRYERNKVRLREQVIMTLGSADSTELTDAELGLLKRRILEKTNRALGKPLVQEVLFSKFNFVER